MPAHNNNGRAAPQPPPNDDEEQLPASGEAFGDELLGRYNAALSEEQTITTIEGVVAVDRTRKIDHSGKKRTVLVVQDFRRADCGCPISHPAEVIRSRWGTYCAKKEHQRVCWICGTTYPHTRSTLVRKKDHCPGCVLSGWIMYIGALVRDAILNIAYRIGRD